MSDKYFRLSTLGQLALESVAGDSVTRLELRPRHLTVLVAVACSPRPLSRDVLATMFWGEESDERARHSLSNALSALRARLGVDALTARRDVIGIAEHLRLQVDAREFAAAYAKGNDDRAVELYRGPFLADVGLPDSPGFEQWVARERSRLEHLLLALCERHVPALLGAAEWERCAALAEQWLGAAPSCAVALTAILRARAGPGTVAALQSSLADHARLSQWLAAEYGIHAAPEVDRLVAELRALLLARESDAGAAAALVPLPAESDASSTPRDAAPGAHPRTAILTHRNRVVRRVSAGAVVTIATAVGLIGLLRRSVAGAAPSAPLLVAITGIQNVRADTALGWLEDGIPQLIADDLASAGTIEPVAPTRVREVLTRERVIPGAAISPDQALDVARRVGANWAVTGGLTSGGGLLILDLAVRDARNGRMIGSFSVAAAGPVQLGQLVAARLLDEAGAHALGAPRFAAAGSTVSADAYRQFVLGMRAYTEARYPEAREHFDAAITLDSGFSTALTARRTIAELHDDTATVTRLQRLIDASRDRLSEFDKLQDQVYRALSDGAVARSEALAERFVARFPRDPRAYRMRATVLELHGRWLAADSVYTDELTLDSLAIEAGDGPCVPCDAYEGLSDVRLSRGDAVGAERAARRWVALQPSVPGAWDELSIVLQFAGRFDEAIEASRRAIALSADPFRLVAFGRTLLLAHQDAAMDSLLAILRADRGALAQDGVFDLSLTLAREHGEFRRAAALAAHHSPGGLTLVEADNLARLGRVADARRLYEQFGHPAGVNPASYGPAQARTFAWAHALEGDALGRAGDTLALRTLIDSVRQVGAHSYYGRDWHLYRHLAGLLALARGDSSGAERDFEAARWGVAGWTRTLLQLARLRLARGRPAEAIATLRNAYAGPLDAMGRYVPRTELDYWMAIAFAGAGRADSAAAYADRVRQEWSGADPEVRGLLAELPPQPSPKEQPTSKK